MTITTAAFIDGLGIGGETDAHVGLLADRGDDLLDVADLGREVGPFRVGERHRDEQRCVRAGTETGRDQVVGPALGERARYVAVVGEAEGHLQDRRGEEREQDQRDRDAHGRPPRHEVGEAVPDAADGLGLLDVAVLPGDALTGEGERGGQQRERGDHHDRDVQRRREPEGGDVRDAGHGEPAERHRHAAPGEQRRGAGGGERVPDGLGVGLTRVPVLQVAAEDEQRVVDADPETDHGAEHRRHRSDGEVGRQEHEREGGHAGGEQRDPDRQDRGEERAEQQEQDHHRDDDPDHVGAVGCRRVLDVDDGAAVLHLDARGGGRGARRLERGRQRGPGKVGEAALVGDGRDGDAAVGRHARHRAEGIGHSRHTGLALHRGEHRLDGGLIGGRPERRAGLRREHDRRGRLLLRREPLLEQVRRLLRVGAGDGEDVAVDVVQRRCGNGQRDREQQPRADDPPPAADDEPAPAVETARARRVGAVRYCCWAARRFSAEPALNHEMCSSDIV